MYRAVAFLALRDGVAIDDGASLAVLAREARISFAADGRIVAADRDVSEEIRRPAVSAAVSEVSAHSEVRAVLLEEQRRIGAAQDIVIEGRDIGTVVFPDAPVKLFLTASAESGPSAAAASSSPGASMSASRALPAIVARDAYDSQRAVAPLRRATTRIEFDTSGLASTRWSRPPARSSWPGLERAREERAPLPSGDRWFYRTVRISRGARSAAFRLLLGRRHLPAHGAALIASNHRASSTLLRWVTPSPAGAILAMKLSGNAALRWAVTELGAIPVRRGESDRAALQAASSRSPAARR